MKKILIIILSLIALPVNASELIDVSFSKCIDGDTAYLYVDGVSTKVRFLAIDTPEYTKEKEEYGYEASEYTCNKLKSASSIQLEYDSTNKVDKYGRLLAWVYVDGSLLQKELVSIGLAEVAYIYGDYAYTSDLCTLEKEAYDRKQNIWQKYSWNKTYCSSIVKEDNYEYYILIIVIVLFLILGFIKFIKEVIYEK